VRVVFLEDRPLVRGQPDDCCFAFLEQFTREFTAHVLSVLTRLSLVTRLQPLVVRAFCDLPKSLVELLTRGSDHVCVSQTECEVLGFGRMQNGPEFCFIESTEFADGLRPIGLLFGADERPSLEYFSPDLQELIMHTVRYLE
jgi:hypothetical protein